jgi:hypothetical protein
MPRVLTTAIPVRCPHVGIVTLTSSTRLRVVGVDVLILAAPPTPLGTVASCPAGSPSLPGTPCLKVLTITAGQAGKLTVGGRPVLLATLVGTTDGTPPAVPPAPGLPLVLPVDKPRLTAV